MTAKLVGSLSKFALKKQINSPGTFIVGIIGEKIPRFCVYGSTLTLASRMESHGLLGRIQISPATKQKVDGLGFQIQDRGEIEVKGVGSMYAYFLEGSSKGDAELLGKIPNGIAQNSVPMNAGGSNFCYDKSLCMAGYEDNLLEGQPIPTNPLLYKGVGKAVTRMTRQKTLAQVELKQKIEPIANSSLVTNGDSPYQTSTNGTPGSSTSTAVTKTIIMNK